MSETQEFDIDDIKQKFSDVDLFNEKRITNLKTKINESGTNSISFAQLFLLSYDTFSNNSHLVKDKNIISCLEGFEGIIDNMRDMIEEYGNGQEIGSFYTKEKIKYQIKIHRKNMNKLIILFFRVFLEEE